MSVKYAGGKQMRNGKLRKRTGVAPRAREDGTPGSLLEQKGRQLTLFRLKDRIAENEDEVVELERRIKRAKRDASSELEDKLVGRMLLSSFTLLLFVYHCSDAPFFLLILALLADFIIEVSFTPPPQAESLAANSQLKSQLAAMSTKLEATEAVSGPPPPLYFCSKTLLC